MQLRVSFEEYLYYATITRAEESVANEAHGRAQGPTTIMSLFLERFRLSFVNRAVGNRNDRQAADVAGRVDVKNAHQGTLSNTRSLTPPVNTFEPELHAANRALRTAGWADLLGPSNTP